MMNVYIDGRWEGNTGIGRVLKEVVKAKPENVEVNLLNTLFKLGDPLSPLYISKEILRSKCDVFYSPSYMPPIYSPIPFIVTIHDLNHLYFYSKFHKFYLKYIISFLSSNAKKIITVSEYTKKELIDKLRISAQSIEVVYNGIDNSFRSNNDVILLDRPYFFYVGNKRNYKNVIRMLQAFERAKISSDFLLLLSGTSNAELDFEINKLNICSRIRFAGNISDEDLPKFYKGAYALLFVSLMEGFGLPIIEAMSAGTPVITSNITSLPEIAGDAALLVDPFNVNVIAEAIERIVFEDDLRKGLVELGYERSKIFTWERCTENIWNIIRN
jgi:glycosyltransferase involved in cell wall biosynthesis